MFSFFKNKNIGSYIVNLTIIFCALFFSFTAGRLNDAEFASQSISMIDGFSRYYPFTTLFVNLIENINIINLLIYFLVPIILMGVFIIFINKGYTPLRTRLLKQSVKTNYKIQSDKNNKNSSPLKGLYIKEIKKYFSN